MKKIQNIKPIYIAFGANLSNPKSSFTAAIDALSELGADIEAMSDLWQSPAWPPESDQPDYINACGRVSWSGEARELLDVLHNVEEKLGRIRGLKNAARILDLDLLDFRGQIMGRLDRPEQMIIPHPRMLDRGFVLFPLSQIAPDWYDPVHNISIEMHIARLPLKDVEPMRWLGRFIGD